MIRVAPFNRRGTYAVYADDRLLVVTCYKKGALAVKAHIEDLEARITELERQLMHTTRRASTPPREPQCDETV